MRAAAENTAFRAALSRGVWPGTEDRRAEAAPATPRPSPGGPGVSSFGPLGAGLPPDTGQAGRSARPDERIWEPRRLYQQPQLKPRRRGDPASPRRRTRPQRAQQAPQQQGPSQGTAPRDVRSGETTVPKPESAAQQGAAQQHRDSPLPRSAITAGSDPARGSGPYSAGSRGPAGPGGPDSGPGTVGTERTPDRLHLGDLMADSRMRIWKRRLLLAIVAGLVFTFIFTWRAGLTAAVLAAIADAIYRSRTTASMPPGVRLTGAQKRTQRQLARMERSGYRALHSRPIPGSREFIDHFVVGPTGAYAIDSESWDKRLPIRTRNALQLYHGPFTKKDRLEHARWEAQQASNRLTSELGTPVHVRPVLAIYGPKVPWHIATIREVDAFDGGRLRRYLRRNAAMRDRAKLNAEEIEQIYAAAARVLPLNNAGQHTPVG
jgi:Nuclease-related domain